MLKDSQKEHSFTYEQIPSLMKVLDMKDRYIIYDLIIEELREIQQQLKGVNNK